MPKGLGVAFYFCLGIGTLNVLMTIALIASTVRNGVDAMTVVAIVFNIVGAAACLSKCVSEAYPHWVAR